jgi:penicillin-binding protein 1A
VLVGFAVLMLLGIAGVGTAGYVAYRDLATDLPDVAALEDYQPSLVTEVYDRHEQLIAEFFVEKRRLVHLTEIPIYVRHATIAAEDSRFYSHSGVDYIGIGRAVWVNLRAGTTREGASTITQQVARNLFLTRERTLRRKVREAILARRIEQQYDKDNILQIYLNQIFYGHNTYGIEAAAQLYCDKSVADLSLADGAMIAGLPPAPNTYSPLRNPQRSLRRRAHVLRRMVDEGYLGPEAATAAEQEPLCSPGERPHVTHRVNKAPYFIEHVRQHLEDEYGPTALYRGGFTVHTTLDLRLQQAAQRAIQDGLLTVDKRIRRGAWKRPSRSVVLTSDAARNTTLIEKITMTHGASPKVRDGDLLTGVVLEAQADSATVAVRKSRGVIKPAGIEWIRSVVGEPGEFGGDVTQLLRRGDVVRVRVTQADPEESSHELALEQDPEVQGALLALEASSNHVLAMIGGYDFDSSQFNRALRAVRQPGSAFKPVIFAAAIEAGMNPTSQVFDEPIVREIPGGDTWEPENYDEEFLGPIPMRLALTKSRNLATINVLERIGVDAACAYARRLVVRRELPCVLSLALGAAEMTLLDVTTLYGVFANQGIHTEPVFITRIVDRYGTIKEEHMLTAQRVMSPEVAYTVTNMLESAVQYGTGRRVRALERPTAGKTGTTNDFHDAWFIGYTPEIVTGVWVGFDNQISLGKRESGGRVAAPIWLAFMQKALQGHPVTAFPIPPGIRFVRQAAQDETAAITRTPEGDPYFEVFIDPNYATSTAALINGTVTAVAPAPTGDTVPPSRRRLNQLDRRRRDTGTPAR